MKRVVFLWIALAGCGSTSEPVQPFAVISTSGSGTAQVTTHSASSPERRASDRARCDEGDLAGCHAAALDAYYRPSDPQTDADALGYFTRACEAGYAASCNGLGALFTEGRGVPQDDARAAELYRSACEQGASTACQHLAQALRSGRGVAIDEDAAARADARHECAFQASLGQGALSDCPVL